MDISAARETFTTFRIEGDPQILLSIIIKKGGTQFLYCQSRVKTNESALNLQFLTQHSEVVQPFKIGFYEYLLQKKTTKYWYEINCMCASIASEYDSEHETDAILVNS